MVRKFMKMRKGSFLIVLTILIIAAFGCGEEKKKPSIILISIDTLRPDRMSLFGNERKATPFMDSLAKKYPFAFSRGVGQKGGAHDGGACPPAGQGLCPMDRREAGGWMTKVTGHFPIL